MKHPEQAYQEHDERMTKADKIREHMEDREILEIFERLDEVEKAADALDKAHIRRARDELDAALDRIAEVLA